MFDRAAHMVRTIAGDRLTDPRTATLLADILDTYGFGLIGDR